MTSKLFRDEAVRHATRRLEGAVSIALPIPVLWSGALLVVVVVGALVFASTATYARKETVVGWVAPTAGLVRVAPRGSGALETLFVAEGDLVRHGAPLARLVVSAEVEAGRVGDALAAGLAAEAQAAERTAAANIARLQSEAAAARQDLRQLRVERDEAEQQSALEERQLALAREDVARAEAVAARGFLPARELDNRRAAAIAAEQRSSENRRRVVAIDRQIAALEARLSSIPIETQAAQAQADAVAAAIAQRQAEIEARTRQMVTAPVAGRVAAMPVQVGQVIDPADAVAVLIPEGSALIAELYVPSRAAGFIREGQEVRLMYQAFPHQRFGTGRATVAAVSSTVLAPQDVAIPGLAVTEPVFRVRAQLLAESVEAYGETIPLQPGMLLTADIVIDRRSLIEWLLDPLYAAGRA